MKFYSVDRRGFYEGKEFIQSNPLSSLNIDTKDENIKKHVSKIITGTDISPHGEAYVNGGYASENVNLEWVLEYERRIHFADKPSRFKSFFGCSSLEDVKYFRDKYTDDNSYKCFELECDEYFKADMVLLNNCSSPLSQSYLSHAYWLGKAAREINQNAPHPFWEYLLTPPIKIIREVQLPED